MTFKSRFRSTKQEVDTCRGRSDSAASGRGTASVAREHFAPPACLFDSAPLRSLRGPQSLQLCESGSRDPIGAVCLLRQVADLADEKIALGARQFRHLCSACSPELPRQSWSHMPLGRRTMIISSPPLGRDRQGRVETLSKASNATRNRQVTAEHRTYSIEFNRQVVQEFLAGEALHGLSKRHDVCRNLIRIWVQKFEAGDFEEDARRRRSPPAIRSPDRGARASGRQAGAGARVSKGAVRNAPRLKSATASVVVGPRASASQKDAG